MASDSQRKAIVGIAVAWFVVIILFIIWLATKLGVYQPVLTRAHRPHDHELDNIRPRRDLERGVVRDDGEKLRDPDHFAIPEINEGESSKRPIPGRRIVHNNTAGPSNIGLQLPRPVPDAHIQSRGQLRRGAIEPVMGGAILIHNRDDETQLIPAGAPLPRGRSRRRRNKSKGKGKARQIEVIMEEEDDAASDVFSLSPVEGRSDSGDLYLVPTPLSAKRPRGRTLTERPVMNLSPTIPGPSRPFDRSAFEPPAPKVSRYRGLSATRPSQKRPKSLSPSPPRLFRVENVEVLAGPAPLPDPETFELGNRPDSWEYFQSDDYNSDEWTSQVCSTVLGPRQAEVDQAPRLAALVFGGNTAAAAAAPEDNNNITNTITNTKANNNNAQAWQLGGPGPDSRILTRKATLPGRQTKFVEVDLKSPPRAASNSPVETTVFKDCLELLREGAKTPIILTDEEEEEKPAMLHGKTRAMSGDLYKRRYNNHSGSEGDSTQDESSKPKMTKSETSWI